jgi:nicotinamidase/pyrazinamidase
VQHDFVPGGALAVPRGDEIVPLANQLAARFANVVLTQDWHPRDHISFASSHVGRQPFETIRLPYGEQVLWPPHCVQGTHGAALHAGLDIPHAQLVIRKGHHREIDSYSAFLEADRKTPTGLAGYLRERGLTELYVCGLATDFCVAWTALDGRAAGFSVTVIEDACRAIDLQGSGAKAWDDMTRVGVRKIPSDQLLRGQAGSRSTTSFTGRSRSKRRL